MIQTGTERRWKESENIVLKEGGRKESGNIVLKEGGRKESGNVNQNHFQKCFKLESCDIHRK